MDFIVSHAPLFQPREEKRMREVIANAMLCYHRFFARRSVKSHDRITVASACVMLAAKAMHRAEFAKHFVHRLLERRDKRELGSVNEVSETFVLAKGELLAAERAVLVALEFDFASLVLPYPAIHATCAAIGHGQGTGGSEVEFVACRTAQEMLRQPRVMLCYDAHTLGYAAVVAACRIRKVPLPPSTFAPPGGAAGGPKREGAAAPPIPVPLALINEILEVLRPAKGAQPQQAPEAGAPPPPPEGAPPPPPPDAPAHA